ncbi:CAMTA1 isoform 18, partial [Pan troglodytes]
GRTDPVSVLMELRGRRTLIKMPYEISAGTQCCEERFPKCILRN